MALSMAARTSSFVVTSSRSVISTFAECQSLVTIDPVNFFDSSF